MAFLRYSRSSNATISNSSVTTKSIFDTKFFSIKLFPCFNKNQLKCKIWGFWGLTLTRDMPIKPNLTYLYYWCSPNILKTMKYCQLPSTPTFTIPDIVPYRPIGQSATPQTKPNNSGYSIYAQQTIFHLSAKIPPRICLADSNDTTTSTHTVKTWQCSILHRPSMCWICSFGHTFHSLVQETGNRKPWIFFTQNNLIHLSPTLNILSQKAQPFGRSNHCGPPKWSLVHHHMSAHICRLHNSWWQDLINSSSLRILPRDLFCAFERFSWHSWQTACWHSPLFARQHMNTQ
jgi:hypothetical protein